MGNITDKLKSFIGFEPIEDEEELMEEAEESVAPTKVEETPKYTSKSSVGVPKKPISSEERLVDIQRKNHMKLILIEPNSYEEASKIVDNLKVRKPIIVNLENLDADVARKIFDFVSGATYAIDGNVQKIANSIFIFAPDNVDIAANIENKSYEEESTNPWR